MTMETSLLRSRARKKKRRQKPMATRTNVSITRDTYRSFKELEQQFKDCFEELVTKVKTCGEKALGIRREKHRMQFIDFLHRFK